MNGALRIRLPRLPVRERRARAILRPVAALAIVAVTCAASPQVEAAGGGLGVSSHIPAAAADAARPLAVIDRTDIELSGMKNVSDLLLGRLHYNSFGAHRPFVLGSGRVAVLVNGRRVSDSTFDLDLLSLSAVERIEILSDSAAALHGGHAIAGAVNVVLRRDYEGVEVQGSLDRPTGAGGDTKHLSGLWGGALGRGHMVIGADVFRRQEIRSADRDYSRASWTPGGPFADASNVSVGGNTLFISTDDGSVARALGDCRGSAYTGVLTKPIGVPGTGCGFAWPEIAWNTERVKKESLFLNLDHPLGEAAGVYVDARAARGDTKFRYAPSVGTFSFTPPAELRSELQRDLGISDIPDRIRVAHRFIGHGNRDWRTDLEEYELTLGVRGRFAVGIGYDAHFRYYRHDTAEDGGTFVSESAVQRAIDEGRYDLKGHLGAIRETGLLLDRDRVTDHKAARVSLDGTAFALSGGDVRWAAGTEVAYEDWRNVYDYKDVLGGSHQAGDVLGSGGISAAGKRRRWSGFAEVSLPLHSDWDVVLAVRRDDHDDVGATVSRSVASRYRLNKFLTFRGSWSEGSKAPSLRDLHLREAIDYPNVCDTKTHAGDLKDCDETQVERVREGNPNLKPDEAQSFSLGAVAGLGPFSLSVDWFRIGISDQPATLSAQSVIDLDAEGRLPSGAAVVRDGGLITRIESPLVNSGETNVSGIDLRGRAGWKADWVDMTFDARWSHLTRYEERVAGELEPSDYPRNRIHASLRATRGVITANWSVYGVSGHWNRQRTARYKAWMGHDVTLRWSGAFGLSGMDLVGGVLNVGDRGPSTDPTDPGALTAEETLDSVRGRTIFLIAKVSL